MNGEEVDRAVRRVEAARPDLGMAVRDVADGMTAGEGAAMIHQAALQQFLWWNLPRDYPDEEWYGLVDATAALLDELRLTRLAGVARSEVTARVLSAWGRGPDEGTAAFRAAHAKSGVDPPNTALLEWGSIMGMDEMRALDAVQRALGDAVAAGDLVPGAPRWHDKAAAITAAVLSRPLVQPPGLTLAELVTRERVQTWTDGAHHPGHREGRAAVAHRLLQAIDPPSNASDVVAPMLWLLRLVAGPGGAELTQRNYLARATVLAAVRHFGWWPWEQPPRSEAEVYQLSILRAAASRRRLIRRRRRALYLTARGGRLIAAPERLWEVVATETEDGEEFTRAVSEIVGLRLLRGSVEAGELMAEVGPILAAQGWSTRTGPLTLDQVSSAVWRPVRWWRLFRVLQEQEAKWDQDTGRRLAPHRLALTSDGERMVVAYLRYRATGPRHRLGAD